MIVIILITQQRDISFTLQDLCDLKSIVFPTWKLVCLKEGTTQFNSIWVKQVFVDSCAKWTTYVALTLSGIIVNSKQTLRTQLTSKLETAYT